MSLSKFNAKASHYWTVGFTSSVILFSGICQRFVLGLKVITCQVVSILMVKQPACCPHKSAVEMNMRLCMPIPFLLSKFNQHVDCVLHRV